MGAQADAKAATASLNRAASLLVRVTSRSRSNVRSSTSAERPAAKVRISKASVLRFCGCGIGVFRGLGMVRGRVVCSRGLDVDFCLRQCKALSEAFTASTSAGSRQGPSRKDWQPARPPVPSFQAGNSVFLALLAEILVSYTPLALLNFWQLLRAPCGLPLVFSAIRARHLS